MNWKLGWRFPWCYLQAAIHDYILGHRLYAVPNGQFEPYLFCNCATVWRTTETTNQSEDFHV